VSDGHKISRPHGYLRIRYRTKVEWYQVDGIKVYYMMTPEGVCRLECVHGQSCWIYEIDEGETQGPFDTIIEACDDLDAKLESMDEEDEMSEPTPEEIIETINESGWNVRFLSPEVATGVYRVLADLHDARRTTLEDASVGDVVTFSWGTLNSGEWTVCDEAPWCKLRHEDGFEHILPEETPCTLVERAEPDPADDPQAYLEERYGDRVKEDKHIHESFDWQFLVRFRSGYFSIYRNRAGISGRLYYGRRYESRLKEGSLPDVCDELESHLKEQLDEDMEVLG